ncbi:hypothetical protein [Polynucleobacter kasalickyi]|nr:hypothetical protein [Polynucleobacter kasalickyi]
MSFVVLFNFSGCAVVILADAAVTVVTTSVKVVAKTVETAVDVVTPSRKKEN